MVDVSATQKGPPYASLFTRPLTHWWLCLSVIKVKAALMRSGVCAFDVPHRNGHHCQPKAPSSYRRPFEGRSHLGCVLSSALQKTRKIMDALRLKFPKSPFFQAEPRKVILQIKQVDA